MFCPNRTPLKFCLVPQLLISFDLAVRYDTICVSRLDSRVLVFETAHNVEMGGLKLVEQSRGPTRVEATWASYSISEARG